MRRASQPRADALPRRLAALALPLTLGLACSPCHAPLLAPAALYFHPHQTTRPPATPNPSGPLLVPGVDRYDGYQYLIDNPAIATAFFEQHLPTADFIRLHRSHLVSLSAINRIEPAGKGSYQANLQDGTIISVSRSGYQRFRSAVKT